ncbi:sugar transferase [Glutamicibacter ardleyensis]|uniref:sugar transferase n=1 Tax=Glutamicibacter ardleyensis TaxID=225894 RepID=UPI003FD0E6AD
MLVAFDTAVVISTITAFAFIHAGTGLVVTQIGVAALWLAVLTVLRTRSIDQIGAGITEYKRVVNAGWLSMGIIAVVAVVLEINELRPVLLVAVPIGTIGLLGERWILRRWLNGKARSGYHLSNVVVVGSAVDVAYARAQLQRSAVTTYNVVGTIIDSASNTDRQVIENDHYGMPQVHGIEFTVGLVTETGADAVIVAGPLGGGSNSVRELSWNLESTETQIILVSSLTNVAGPRIRVRPVDGLPMMHVDLPSFTGTTFVLKRTMDIIGSLFALFLLTPILLLLSVLVKRDSAGAVFFNQERVGLRGSHFKMLKFRSMVANAEELKDDLRADNEGNGVLFKMKHDPRVTKVGEWMRKHSLDELPQFYNVLRGDMSLVGPRPPLPDEVAAYTGHTERRLYIKPGLTGLWQVSGRSDLPEEEAVRLDLYYVENWSILGDFMIMWRTLKVMLNGKGAY